MGVLRTGKGVTRGEAGICTTLDTVVGSTAKDGFWDGQSPHRRGVANETGTEELVIRFLLKKEGGCTYNIPRKSTVHYSAR
jgi:hypothetical protein